MSNNLSGSTSQQSTEENASNDTFVYVVLGILVLGFLFFVGNTIRCYLSRPRNVDFED